MFNSMMQVATLFGSQFSNYMFISFAPPKETNQRKGGPKCKLQPKRALATQALLALPFWLQFAPFRGLPSRFNI
jgi:hypothetical protein